MNEEEAALLLAALQAMKEREDESASKGLTSATPTTATCEVVESE